MHIVSCSQEQTDWMLGLKVYLVAVLDGFADAHHCIVTGSAHEVLRSLNLGLALQLLQLAYQQCLQLGLIRKPC